MSYIKLFSNQFSHNDNDWGQFNIVNGRGKNLFTLLVSLILVNKIWLHIAYDVRKLFQLVGEMMTNSSLDYFSINLQNSFKFEASTYTKWEDEIKKATRINITYSWQMR